MPSNDDPRSETTPCGFRYGAVLVERCWHVGSRVCLVVQPDHGEELRIYVSPTGRSVRVYRGDSELKEKEKR